MPPRVELQWRRARPLFSGAAAALRAAAGMEASRGPSWSQAGAAIGRCYGSSAAPAAATTTTTTASTASSTAAGSDSCSGGGGGGGGGQPVVSWPTLALEAEERRRRQKKEEETAGVAGLMRRQDGPDKAAAETETDAISSGPPSSPGAVLIDSLARDPVKPHGSSSSLSALVEPSVRYRHPRETRRSLLRHRSSLVRQARLEAIRQQQLRPLPDWREILRRLVEGTARQNLLQLPDMPLSLLSLPPSPSSSSSASLSSLPPSSWHREAVSFALPRSSLAVGELLRGTDGTLWAIRDRTGCVLKLYQEKRGAAAKGRRPWLLTLSGTETAIQRAAAEVLRMAKDAVHVAVDMSSTATAGTATENATGEATGKEGTADSRWQLVSSSHHRNEEKRRDDAVFRHYVLSHSAHEIARPSVWTRDSLERYVAALTNGQPAQHLTWDSSDGSEDQEAVAPAALSHERTVVDLLLGVFSDEAVRPALSTAAFKMALAYMCRRGETFRPDARALFVRAETLGLPLDTATFNLMLASQVKTQDLRNFGATLLLMRGRGHAPDLDTWLLFLRLFASEEVKRHILHAMHARGLLFSQAAVRRIAPEMAHHDAERALQEMAAASGSGKSSSSRDPARGEPPFLDDFLARQTARYGSGWLGRDAANRILEVLGCHGRFDDCQRLIALLRPRQTTQQTEDDPQNIGTQLPDIVTFNIVLTHCKLQNSLLSAISVVQQMPTGQPKTIPSPSPSPSTTTTKDIPPIMPDDITYQLLFDMAWTRRLPHVLGVIWHYASAARLTNHWIRKRVNIVLDAKAMEKQRARQREIRQMAEMGQEKEARRKASSSSSSSSGKVARRLRIAPAETERLVDVLRADMVPADGQTASSCLGNVVSARLAERYDGWEPAVPLGDAMKEALSRDNKLLRARFTGDASEFSLLRIPLRRKKADTQKAGEKDEKDQDRDRDQDPDPNDNGTAYMDIRVRRLPPRAEAPGPRPQ